MTIADRLLEFIQYLDIPAQVFEKQCGISGGTASRLSSKSYPKTFGKIASSYPELNMEWLKTGEGTMLKNPSNAKLIGGTYSVNSLDDEIIMVDYIPISATASFIESMTGGGYDEIEKYPIVPRNNERNEVKALRIFEVEGDSMFPTISARSLILAKKIPKSSWHYAEGVVVAVFKEYIVVKRIARNALNTDNYILFSSDNKDYGEMTVALADLRGLYKAIRIISSEIR